MSPREALMPAVTVPLGEPLALRAPLRLRVGVPLGAPLPLREPLPLPVGHTDGVAGADAVAQGEAAAVKVGAGEGVTVGEPVAVGAAEGDAPALGEAGGDVVGVELRSGEGEGAPAVALGAPPLGDAAAVALAPPSSDGDGLLDWEALAAALSLRWALAVGNGQLVGAREALPQVVALRVGEALGVPNSDAL